jgi:alanine-glyoxylate transaminase/serine-glyoxylate transaminase/serine-pyruvate transaminase
MTGASTSPCGSQKGLMLPPGLGILGVSRRALALAEQHGGSPRHFFDWAPIMRENRIGLFPYTPATLMLFGLREALTMLVDEEDLDNVYARHAQLAGAMRAAVKAWGRPIVEADLLLEHDHDGARAEASTVTRLRPMPASATHCRWWRIGELSGTAFRIGHLGALNELSRRPSAAPSWLCRSGYRRQARFVACQRAFLGRRARAGRVR